MRMRLTSVSFLIFDSKFIKATNKTFLMHRKGRLFIVLLLSLINSVVIFKSLVPCFAKALEQLVLQ